MTTAREVIASGVVSDLAKAGYDLLVNRGNRMADANEFFKQILLPAGYEVTAEAQRKELRDLDAVFAFPEDGSVHISGIRRTRGANRDRSSSAAGMNGGVGGGLQSARGAGASGAPELAPPDRHLPWHLEGAVHADALKPPPSQPAGEGSGAEGKRKGAPAEQAGGREPKKPASRATTLAQSPAAAKRPMRNSSGASAKAAKPNGKPPAAVAAGGRKSMSNGGAAPAPAKKQGVLPSKEGKFIARVMVGVGEKKKKKNVDSSPFDSEDDALRAYDEGMVVTGYLPANFPSEWKKARIEAVKDPDEGNPLSTLNYPEFSHRLIEAMGGGKKKEMAQQEEGDPLGLGQIPKKRGRPQKEGGGRGWRETGARGAAQEEAGEAAQGGEWRGRRGGAHGAAPG